MKHIKLFEGFLLEGKKETSPKKYGIAAFSRDYKEKQSATDKYLKAIVKKYPDFYAGPEQDAEDSVVAVFTNFKPFSKLKFDSDELWNASYAAGESDANSIIWFDTVDELNKKIKELNK